MFISTSKESLLISTIFTLNKFGILQAGQFGGEQIILSSIMFLVYFKCVAFYVLFLSKSIYLYM